MEVGEILVVGHTVAVSVAILRVRWDGEEIVSLILNGTNL